MNQELRIKEQGGFGTLEMLIALAVAVFCLSAVILVSFGNQSVSADSQTNSEALNKIQSNLEKAIGDSRYNFDSVISNAGTYLGIYMSKVDVPTAYTTACSKLVSSTVSWTGDHNRTLSVTATTTVTNVPLMLALGGNCDTVPPIGGWNPPATWASGNFNPGKPTSLDVLNKVVYMAGDKAPYLYIANINVWTQGQSNGPFVTFANGFNDGIIINDLKVAKASNGRIYAYVARGKNTTTTNQFEVIDVTDIYNPVSIGKYTLAGVSGSYPQGFRVYYFNGKAYVTTQYTAGPEFHVFDVSTPWNAVSIHEIGSGTNLGITVEDFTVARQYFGGTWHDVAYMATDGGSKELLVMDVTNSPATIISTPAGDLPGIQNGASVRYINGFLYFGRDSTPSGSDLYIFDVHDPQNIFIKSQQDINTGVIGIDVSGVFAFLATPKTSKEFQVWTSDPTNIYLISPFNFPNVIAGHGVKYENNFVYVASAGNDALRILYSP